MNLIEKKVQWLMEEYADGGTTYFDALDMCLKGEYQIILQLILSTEPLRPLALQGGFGLAVRNLMNIYGIKRPGIIWLKSSPRQGEQVEYDVENEILNNPIFLDDSCYSGKTIQGMDQLLERDFGLNVHFTNVIYDGSKSKLKSLESFFRYHDYY